MNLMDFSLFDDEMFVLKHQITNAKTIFQTGKIIELIYSQKQYLLSCQDSNFAISETIVPNQISEVFLRTQREGLWVVQDVLDDKLIVRFLAVERFADIDLTLSVDDKVMIDLFKQKFINKQEISNAIEWIKNQFIFDNLIFTQIFDNRQDDNHFVIIGKEKTAHVARQKNGVWQIARITPLRKHSQFKLLCLKGIFDVLDNTIASQLISTSNQVLLDASVQEYGDYLKLWNKYGQLELKKIKKQAKELGFLPYGRFEVMTLEDKRYRLFGNAQEIHNFYQKSLMLPSDAIFDIYDKKFNWEIDKIDELPKSHFRGILKFHPTENYVDFIVNPNVEQREKFLPQGFVGLSLSGSLTVQKRRENAKDIISSRKNLPQLQNYLQNTLAPRVRYGRILRKLTSYIKQSFKNGVPTERQAQAILTAINTPDIALIVGPPGTGKTQVIAGLQRGLAEIADPNHRTPQAHQILVSSFQHDAVDNALERTDVFGLPALRIGGKINQEQSDSLIKNWINNQKQSIESKLIDLKTQDPIAALMNQLDECLLNLRLRQFSPKEYEQALASLSGIINHLEKNRLNLSRALKDELNQLLEKYHKSQNDNLIGQKSFIRQIRALRTTSTSFDDDGADKSYHLLKSIKRNQIAISQNEQNLLEKLSSFDVEPNEEELNKLTQFKLELLRRFFVPTYIPPKLNTRVDNDVLNVLTKIENELLNAWQQSKHSKTAILINYLNQLDNEPDAIKEAIYEYSDVIGATCQQSASEKMASLKNVSKLDVESGILFDTVIIDEAARANPLDLFVPMAMAKRRIILVGDDRQLPHLVQQDLEDELTSELNLSKIEQETYQQSLFERLRKQLEKQEKEDGIQRVVMLDTQYRMHPVLGDFISKNFYENNGLSKIHSGRKADDFSHNITPYQNKCAVWLNVPFDENSRPKKQGTSWTRQAEAIKIANEVKRIADEAGNTVSIGIISFYLAQSQLILKELEKLGVAERNDNGQITISRLYAYTPTGEERIRVGTVDSFQGKEFDIVFLSVVRAGTNKSNNYEFGHLRLANRLNVAMSRQRKLLIAVGDKIMANSEQAKEQVPALYQFLQLCKEL